MASKQTPSHSRRIGLQKWNRKKRNDKSKCHSISYHQVADLDPLMRINPTLEAWPKLLCFANQSHDQRSVSLLR